MPATSDSVKVAVRVRPFNQREKNAGSKCVISMKNNSTTITNPNNGETKTFAFDHSYWSHDSFKENSDGIFEPAGDTNVYTNQQRLFSDLGQGVLDNAWQGYNAALFAYGQTGSGKSYSMIGYGPNKGIVPITCEELFKVIEDNKDDTKQMRVFFSMLEIYNEQVRDLLLKGKPPHGGLKVRQNPKSGFYVEGLKQVPVRNYTEIEQLMESGTVNRTTAATNMNATSSRSHMVITIRFEQVILNAAGQSNTRSSDINLVDLAGSERADSTGATGDRLKEGSAINQSLSTLGNVISALADIAMGKKKVMVPYRDSVLTKLLQSALGGNSRTIMIAALSPADINYDETLSTLRYADRAKKIQNKAVVNESPTDRLIRELKEENARLMSMLKKQGGGDTSEIQQMLEDNQKRMMDMQMSWEQRLQEARREWERSQQTDSRLGTGEWNQHPYISNINEDPQLSGIIKHTFCAACSIIGRSGTESGTIEVRGLGIQAKHLEVHIDGRTTTINPCSESAVVLLNGVRIREKTHLHHLDRLKLGSGSLFLYHGYPGERGDGTEAAQFDFDYFMSELAEHEGVSVDIATPRDISDHTLNMSNRILFQDFVDLMPKLAEASAISDELKRNTTFEPIVKNESSHDPKGKADGKEVIIRVTNTRSHKVWMWSKHKFYNRKDLMDELYLRFLDGDHVILTRDKDPFWDPVEDIFLGSCHVMLQSLSYCSETDEHFTIHNYHGKEEAVAHVQILPCDDKGSVIEDDLILEPKDMLNKPLTFLFALPQCMGVRWINEDHTRGIELRFTIPFQKPTKTKAVWHKAFAEFGYKQQYKYKKVTDELLEYFTHNFLVLELWGKQVSEDEQIRKKSAKTPALDRVSATDILSQLKLREDESEKLQQECDQLKKENFKLKQSILRHEEKYQLLEMRSMSKKGVKGQVSHSAVDHMAAPSPGLDVEFAKALRDFFREMRDIQGGLKDMKEYVNATKGMANLNGTRKPLEDQEKILEKTEEKLNSSLTFLKKNAAMALRKSRPGTSTD